MNKRNQKSRAADTKEYVALTISRERLRSELGDQVADQLSDTELQGFAQTLGDFYWSTAKEDWPEILAEAYDVDFDD